ncbi:MAG: heavy metal translocating P-type ATPase [Anaerovibrio sp.]|uniref:heavy metal translocating P-type ATPase n=1 Tax=Anaerovibrio sp. TaxID=1872532 RepID=UPI0025CF6FC8|nr:heavy metal translocating P-type ATPase [Anaerovibrio sp.]MCR5177180.1 heavy metal translocating P-type ATPase [Anaerovibrio sp.]
MVKEKYDITGMTCSACSARVEKTVRNMAGVDEVAVNLLTNSMQVVYDGDTLSSREIISGIEGAGYGAALHGGNKVTAVEDDAMQEMKTRRKKLLWSLGLLLIELYVAMHQMIYGALGIEAPELIRMCFDGPENALSFAFTQLLLVIPIILLNKNYYINGFKNIVSLAPNMDSLVGLGSASALFYGIVNIYFIGWYMGHGDFLSVSQYSTNLYFESAGMIVTLVSIGKYLEARAKHGTTAALRKLMDYAPKIVIVERNGAETDIPADQLVKGDIVIAKPGTIIAADGIIIEGKTIINEAIITGESLPVEKFPGDNVVSGTINENGRIRYEACQVGADSTLNRLIGLVEEASSSKAPMAKLADKIAGWFVPAVMLIALCTGVIWLMLGYGMEFAFSMAVSVLVISCPCALGLATPVAIMAGIGKGAENGILIKSGEILEMVSKVSAIVLDKTGTITQGSPSVTDIIPVGISETQLIHAAAVLEKNSEHPIGKAIVEHAGLKADMEYPVTDFKAVLGQGIMGRLQDDLYYLGNLEFIRQNCTVPAEYREKAEKLSDAGKTVLFMAAEGKLQGIIGVADEIKQSSFAAIDNLKKMGLKVVMLTGDNEHTATAIASQLRLNEYIAGVHPEEKTGYIKKMQATGAKVAMVGDGVNDAPALAMADAGIAIGAGTDIAIESADAVLAKNDLNDVVNLIHLSRKVIVNIKENLFWAFFYNIICIPVAAGILYPIWGIRLTPMIGAAAMSFSSVCVVLNALRLKGMNLRRTASAELSQETVSENINFNYKEENVMQVELKINGMMCAHCQKNVERVLGAMDGVESVNVNLEAGTALVNCTETIPMDSFAKIISDAGYELVK